MWSNVRNGLPNKKADQSSTSHNKAATSSNPFAGNHASSSELYQMMQEISADLSQVARVEQESVRTQFALKAREYCMKDISHDLRTPLNAIIGFAQLMENGTLGKVENPQYLEYLRHIRESGYELLGKVEGLLDGVENSGTSEAVSHHFQSANKLEEAVA